MDQLLTDDLWPTIKRLSRKKGRKLAAIAYVTSDETVRFGAGDLLVTDASDGAIKSGQTSAGVLGRAIEAGAEVFSLPSLHAKVLLLDGTAVIGSANLSASSQSGLVEAAWVSDNPAATAMASSMVLDLSEAAEPIDAAFLERIKALSVSPREWNGKATALTNAGSKRRAHRTWMIGVHEIEERPDEQAAVATGMAAAKKLLTDRSSDVAYIRFTGRSQFRREADRGDTVIQIWRPAGNKRPSFVYRHAPIIRRQDEAKCTRFFVQESSEADKTAVSWGSFRMLVRRVGLPGKIVPNMARSILQEHSQALFSLWGGS